MVFGLIFLNPCGSSTHQTLVMVSWHRVMILSRDGNYSIKLLVFC